MDIAHSQIDVRVDACGDAYDDGDCVHQIGADALGMFCHVGRDDDVVSLGVDGLQNELQSSFDPLLSHLLLANKF